MAAVGAPVPADIRVVPSREAAVRDADIVVAATTAHTPVFDGRHLKPGAFVVAAGAYEASAREVDSETIRRASKRVIDSKADCLADAGDLQIPLAEGILKESDIAGIAEVVAGTRPGRERADEITYYKSTGVPIQDLVTAQAVERRAAARGIGTVIEIGGDHD
jgi:ornithine cyclodeaminase/alanine dehydrogenase-like protein (mu-crystallin family)